MTEPVEEPERQPSNDHRPNSGLREGETTHADANAAIARLGKTVIFGQQTRLRLGELTEDDKLPRYHAGHDLVKFFYGGVRQIPEHLLDAILGFGISVTMVQGSELIVFKDSRCHQSLHTGYTRKTIYMPEAVLKAAFEKGYDYWVIAEVIIQESWPLMDYLAILELCRRFQQRIREKGLLPGYYFVKDGLRELASHRRFTELTEDNEFNHLWLHYQERLLGWSGGVVERDPYEVTDAVFDEPRERQWAQVKIHDIKTVFGFPDLFDLDRDIVHPAAFEMAEKLGQPVEPQTVEEAMHDLADVSRFRVSRQIKADGLMRYLIDAGGPGVRAFIEGVAMEKASGFEVIAADYHDGWDAVTEFKKILQEHSDTCPEGGPGSISNDFNDLHEQRVLHHLRTELARFEKLPAKDQEENLTYMREMARRMVAVTRSDLDANAQEEAVATPPQWTPARCVRHWSEMAQYLLQDIPEELDKDLLAVILRKLDRHPAYHSLFRGQVAQLVGWEGMWQEDVRSLVTALCDRLPKQPYRYSADPGGVSSRLRPLEIMRRNSPDDPAQLSLLMGIVVRLDKCGDQEELIRMLAPHLDRVQEALEEVLEQISFRDERRGAIRRIAEGLLERGGSNGNDAPDAFTAPAAGEGVLPGAADGRENTGASPAGGGRNQSRRQPGTANGSNSQQGARDAEEREQAASTAAEWEAAEEQHLSWQAKLDKVLPPEEEMSERVMVMAFYHLAETRANQAQMKEGVRLVREMLADGWEPEEIKTAIRWTIENVDDADDFVVVWDRIAEAQEDDGTR